MTEEQQLQELQRREFIWARWNQKPIECKNCHSRDEMGVGDWEDAVVCMRPRCMFKRALQRQEQRMWKVNRERSA